MTSTISPASSPALITNIVNFLDESKAENIIALDLRAQSAYADHIIIADGRSQRHLRSTAEKLKRHLYEQGLKSIHVEGLNLCDWVLIDSGDVVVHLFRPEIRSLYNLEKLWQPGFNRSAMMSASTS